MNTQENNKLIAEFMGITPNEAGVYHVSKHKGYSLDNLLYHTSWDWLMPVVEKCMQTGDNTDEWDDLYNALSTVNKTNLHEAVVEFINQYNKIEIMEESIKYAIYFDYSTLGQWDGEKELQVITNNPKKWLEEHNAQRDEDSQESLDDFIIETLTSKYINYD